MVSSNQQKSTKNIPIFDGTQNPFTYEDMLTFEWFESDYTGNQIYFMVPKDSNHPHKKTHSHGRCVPSSTGEVGDTYHLPSKGNKDRPERINVQLHTPQINKSNGGAGYHDVPRNSFQASGNPVLSSKIQTQSKLLSNASEKSSTDNSDLKYSLQGADYSMTQKATSLTKGSIHENDQTINAKADITTRNRFKERLYTLTVDEIEHYKKIANVHLKQFASLCEISLDSQSYTSCKEVIVKGRNRRKLPTEDVDVLSMCPYECVKNFGLPLPPAIYKATQYVAMKAHSTEGIFRRCGLKSRKNKLIKSICECPSDINSFREYTSFDIADIVKYYLARIPGTIFTRNLFPIFSTLLNNTKINECLDNDENHSTIIRSHLDFARVIVLSLPDEYREILQVILEMLKTVSNHSDENGMTVDNLATCLTPSMFQLSFDNATLSKPSDSKLTDKRQLDINIPSLEIPFYYEFIWNTMPKKLTITQLGCPLDNPQCNYLIYMCTALATVYEQYVSKFQQWEVVGIFNSIIVSKVEPNDGINVKVYRGFVDIDQNAQCVMHEILHNMHLWNSDIHRYAVIESHNQSTDIIYYRYLFGPFYRDFTLLRSWKYYEQSEMALIASTSVQMTHSDIDNTPMNDRLKVLLKNSPNRHRFGIILASRYLIEKKPHGCRVTYILRADLRGRDISYCDNFNPYLVSRQLILLKEYFNKNKILK